MLNKIAKQHIENLLEEANITVGGSSPGDIEIHDESVYKRILFGGLLAIGESYTDKQWDSNDLVATIEKLITSGLDERKISLDPSFFLWKSTLINLQKKSRSFEVGTAHYDLGNELYELMLGGTHMQYTCGIWNHGAADLNEAQMEKMDHVCKTLDLKPGKRLLDVGCGWGGLMKFASENYGIECVGISVSKEQTSWARESFGDLPCEITITDYRDFYDDAGFDYVTSIEMIEAVGPKNFHVFFKKMHSLLKTDGKFLLQAIVSAYDTPETNPWFDKYIFPNGIFPAAHQLQTASYGLFHWDKMEDFGTDYETTLRAWWSNLDSGYETLRKIDPKKYNDNLYRIFKFYLLSMAANAKVRRMYDWQLLMTKR